MREFARKTLAGVALIFSMGFLEIWLVEHTPPADALFCAFTLFLTGDAGSLHFDQVHPLTKICASLMMMTGAVAMAATFGFVADFLVSSRLQQFLGKKVKKMKNHVILAGLGQTGFRIFEELQHFGDTVTVLESVDTEFTNRLRKMGVVVLLGDLHSSGILEEANIAAAKSLIVATDNDLVNVELAVNAKELRPDINIVLRMFDQRLANKLQAAFGIRAAFSATALAAPAFAAASHCDTVVDSIHLGEALLVTAEIEVAAKSDLVRQTYVKIEKQVEMSVLCFQPFGRKAQMHPRNLSSFQAGDKMTVICTLPNLEKLQEMNQPKANWAA
jgi:voltage-gated potassium channel